MNANLIRPGWVIEHNGKQYSVIKIQLIQPGKGGAFIQVEMRDVATGLKTNERWRTADTVEKLNTESIDCQHAELFEKEENKEELGEIFKAHETVTAGYVRYDHHFTKSLSAMIGVRLENTHLKYSGKRLVVDKDNDSVELNDTPENTDTYLNVLPSALLKYDLNDALSFRLSYTNTIARPMHLFPGLGNTFFQLFAVHVFQNRIGNLQLLFFYDIGTAFCLRLAVGLNQIRHLSGFPDLLWRDVMLFVVAQLLFPATVGLINGLLHAFRYAVGIHDGFAVHVTGCTSNGLCQ